MEKSYLNTKKSIKRESGSGFTMVELIITLAILSFGIIGVYNAFYSMIILSNNISSRFTATYLSQEGLEIVRNIRDNNFILSAAWSNGLLGCNLGCQGDYKTNASLQAYNNNFLKLNTDGFYSYDSGVATKFKRKITITQPSGTDTLKAIVQVLWDDNGKPSSFETEEYLYNWH